MEIFRPLINWFVFFHYIIKNYTKYLVNVKTSFVVFIATKTNIHDMDVKPAPNKTFYHVPPMTKYGLPVNWVDILIS